MFSLTVAGVEGWGCGEEWEPFSVSLKSYHWVRQLPVFHKLEAGL